MDIIIAAIAGALGNLGSDAVKAGYNKLKELLLRKSAGAAGALESLEQKPDSANRKGVLKEELEADKADKDAEIVKAAEDLLALLGKVQPSDRVNVHLRVIGNDNIFSGTGNVTVTR